ncbi:hypothetical protein OG589_15725 [Sphaerisporangium sp. NBC_01403]
MASAVPDASPWRRKWIAAAPAATAGASGHRRVSGSEPARKPRMPTEVP